MLCSLGWGKLKPWGGGGARGGKRNLPVSEVIPDLVVQCLRAVVERVEIHVESIDDAITLVGDDDDGALRAGRSQSLGIGQLAFQEIWELDEFFNRREEDFSPGVVQLIQIIESQRFRCIADGREVDTGIGALDVFLYVAWIVLVALVQEHVRSWDCQRANLQHGRAMKVYRSLRRRSV